jgi:NADPH:quinone reductase-like Zn-dependent oxidoreductase
MKAIVYENYGAPDVLKMQDVPTPEPKAGEILVRVHASSVTTADWRMRASAFPGGLWLAGRLMVGLFRPKNRILGTEFSGEVAGIGEDVTEFKTGDPVFGFSWHGSNAEYVTVPASGPVVRKPDGLSHEEAAALPFGALASLVFLRDYGKVQPGQKVLVIGASGGVGTYAVQIAKRMGAEVTGVASTGNLDFIRGLGADEVIDYRTEDYTVSGRKWHVIFDTVGAIKFDTATKIMTGKGVFLPLNFNIADMFRGMFSSLGNGQRMVTAVNGDTKEDMREIATMAARGQLRAAIDQVFPLERTAEAHAYVEGRHRRGSVVVSVIGSRERMAAE